MYILDVSLPEGLYAFTAETINSHLSVTITGEYPVAFLFDMYVGDDLEGPLKAVQVAHLGGGLYLVEVDVFFDNDWTIHYERKDSAV